MKVEFSVHAKQQIKRRNISTKHIIKTISNPDEILSSYRDRKLRRKLFGSKMLEVVTRTEGSKIIVITAYHLEN